MPGEENLLKEFTEGLQPRVLGQLLKVVFDKMKLAGEAGSLLKIEQEIHEAVTKAKKQWLEEPKMEQAALFADLVKHLPKQEELQLDVKGIIDETFWNQAEERILLTLRDYAEHAESGLGIRRRLFAEDAVQGFAYLDIFRKCFDVVLINPPFGDSTLKSRTYIAAEFPDAKAEIAMAFISRFALKLEPGGRLGAITNRVFIANDTLEDWRGQFLLGGQASLKEFLDIGYGVLDDALVETAAYVIELGGNDRSEVSFMRVLDERNKERAIYNLLVAKEPFARSFIFKRKLYEFINIPGKVLAYQIPRQIIQTIFQRSSLTQHGGAAVVGLQPSDDFRFVRLVWEVPTSEIGSDGKWVFYAKGGEYNPYWDDIHLLVNWGNNGAEIKNFYDANGKLRSRPQNIPFYFRSGVTYPERTTSDFSPRVLPKDCIFSVVGQAVFTNEEVRDAGYIVGANSRPFKLIVDGLYGSGDSSVPGSAAKHYRCGVISELPAPVWEYADDLKADLNAILSLSAASFSYKETSRYYCGLASVESQRDSLAKLASTEISSRMMRLCSMLESHHRVEESVFAELGFKREDRTLVNELVGSHPLDYNDGLTEDCQKRIAELWPLNESEIIKKAVQIQGARRQLTKKSFLVDRRLELVAHTLQLSAKTVANAVQSAGLLEPDYLNNLAVRIIQYLIGLIFGRWDIRSVWAKPDTGIPVNPFETLPNCPPAMLCGPDGLPANTSRIVSEEWLRARLVTNMVPLEGTVSKPSISDEEYPVRITWDGILVDDPGLGGTHANPDELMNRLHEVLDLLWNDRSHHIEQEACESLGVTDLRNYFGKHSGFFQDHLKQYSKSRRKAPIYWPLSTASGSYTLWIYCHRLADQTMFRCVNDFLNPKIDEVSKNIESLQKEISENGKMKQRAELEKLHDFRQELNDFRDELLNITKLPYKPNLNDGVLITASPLWKLFRHSQWRKELKKCWDKLETGEYDWAHLAYSIWPDRVKEKCKIDRSITIAHNLEHICEVDKTKTNKKE